MAVRSAIGGDTTVNKLVHNGQLEILDTRQKALRVNLDLRRCGTFAEIGAGQEVDRWFFRAGGASGTIAQSISAYDMTFSDAIYGSCQRYVCRPRLQSMLDHEYACTLNHLRRDRGESTAFFAFADTVAARNYQGTNECHGWMGVKFQTNPGDDASQVIIHVRMLDSDNALQQEALGVVGVNLLFAAFYLLHDSDRLIESLLDELSVARIEIDMIEFSGAAFRQIDNRIMSMKLVHLGLSDAAMFAADGTVLQPSEVLHKRPILVERGSFLPVTHVNVDLLRCAHEKFAAELGADGNKIVQLMEITMSKSYLTIHSRDVLAQIAAGDLAWEAMVPTAVANVIKQRRYFGYQTSPNEPPATTSQHR